MIFYNSILLLCNYIFRCLSFGRLHYFKVFLLQNNFYNELFVLILVSDFSSYFQIFFRTIVYFVIYQNIFCFFVIFYLFLIFLLLLCSYIFRCLSVRSYCFLFHFSLLLLSNCILGCLIVKRRVFRLLIFFVVFQVYLWNLIIFGERKRLI